MDTIVNFMRHRMLTKAVLAAALILVPGGVASTAVADVATVSDSLTVELSETDVQNLRDILAKYEVPAEQQESLIELAKSGEPWDVYDASAVPVSVETDTVISGFNYTIKRYADGSVAATGMEIPVAANGVGSMAISQCTYATGSGYHNATGCQIDGVWGSVLIGAINVSWTLVQGGPDRITNWGYGYQKCFAPTGCSSPTRVMSQAVEGGGLYAHARWQADVSAAWGTWNVWVQLNVGKDSAWQSNS
jgi:hypothetical protein